jgi:hypothetical protein
VWLHYGSCGLQELLQLLLLLLLLLLVMALVTHHRTMPLGLLLQQGQEQQLHRQLWMLPGGRIGMWMWLLRRAAGSMS